MAHAPPWPLSTLPRSTDAERKGALVGLEEELGRFEALLPTLPPLPPLAALDRAPVLPRAAARSTETLLDRTSKSSLDSRVAPLSRTPSVSAAVALWPLISPCWMKLIPL